MNDKLTKKFLSFKFTYINFYAKKSNWKNDRNNIREHR